MSALDKPLRVLLIEQQTLFGKAIAHVLAIENEISITHICNGRAGAWIEDKDADVVMIDLNYDVEDVEASVRYFRQNCPAARVCFLSTYADPEQMQRCIAAGADGYIIKDTSFPDLIKAIKAIGKGDRFVDPRIEHLLLSEAEIVDHPAYSNQLSPRETDIIQLIARGMSNRDIGQELALSEKTVRTHVSRIFAKLRIATRSQAAVHAIRNGLV